MYAARMAYTLTLVLALVAFYACEMRARVAMDALDRKAQIEYKTDDFWK